MRVEVKVCGLTRPTDARAAADLGARYIGVIFARGPRTIDPKRAREVLDGGGNNVDRVGVFGEADIATVVEIVSEARLDIVQLHADPSAETVRAVRDATGARVWAVLRVAGALTAPALQELWASADALVLDSKVKGVLGGSGVSFDWAAAGAATHARTGRLVVAGGLTASNVGEAIETLSPEVVDVSSGVESSPGIKDHARIADFIAAVRRTGVLR
ncbi:MAG TPA: phosphoribosylanthranilate isomerase [Gemmatimonadaceae bacterium]|nr:phosphoribosylanthranilate isomerase [Gemmatimonadaceae bacterium]